MAKLTRAGSRRLAALAVHLTPRMATDELPSVPRDLRAIIVGLPANTNRVSQRAALAQQVQTIFKPRLAEDADLEDVSELLEAIEKLDGGDEDDEGEDLDPNSAMPMVEEEGEDADEHEHAMEAIREFCRDKMDPKDCARLDEMLGAMHSSPAEDAETDEEFEEGKERRGEDAKRRMGRDESDEEKEKREREEREAHDRKRSAMDRRRAEDARKRLGRDETPEEMRERVIKDKAADSRRAMDRKTARDRKEAKDNKGHAMDQAMIDRIKRETAESVIKQQRDIRAAEEAVRPYVGSLPAAYDSAEGVYREAFKILKVPNADKMHPDAFAAVLSAQPRADQKQSQVRMAQDAAPQGVKSYRERVHGKAA